MDELKRYYKKRLERLVNYRDQFDVQRQGSVFQDCKHLLYSCTVQSFIGLMKIAFEGLSVEPETHNCGIWSREFTYYQLFVNCHNSHEDFTPILVILFFDFLVLLFKAVTP